MAGALRLLPLCYLAILVATFMTAANEEQRVFSAEDEALKHPAPVPPGVIELLTRDSTVRDTLASEHLAGKAIPASWLLASEIHLRSASEKDLIVIGEGPLSGANVTTFWIFRPSGGGYKALLNDAPAELLSATAATMSSVVCKFDGVMYVPTRKTLQPIP